MKRLTLKRVTRQVASVLTLGLLATAIAGPAQAQKAGNIGVNKEPDRNAPAAWRDVPVFTLNGGEGWIAQRQSKELAATDEGAVYKHERIVFQSPWGEKAEMEVVVVPSESGGANGTMTANGTMLVSFGNLEMEIAAGSQQGFKSIAVSDGNKWAQDVVSPLRKAEGLSVVPQELNIEPYQMIAQELTSQFSEEFLTGLQANFVGESPAPVLFGDCMLEMGSCALSLVGYGISTVMLASCFTASVPTCIAGIIGHEVNAAAAVLSCTAWIHCEQENDPCN